LGVGELELGVGVAGGLVVGGLLVGVDGALEVGVEDGVVGALEGVLAAGVGLAVVAVALGLVVAAVSWAAHGFVVAAGAGLAVPISNTPASPAGTIKNIEMTPNACMARRLIMIAPSPSWSSPVRAAPGTMMSLSTRVAFPASLIRHLAGLPRCRLPLKAYKTVGDDRPARRSHGGCRVDAAG
jgi:hypothetical protein